MYRSFTDRVFGGVCGGLATDFRLRPWWFRLAFVVFAVASLGVGVALYLALWWAMPQESLIAPRRASSFRSLLIIAIFIGIVGIWAANLAGWFDDVATQPIVWPAILLILGGVFFLRQVRA